MACRGTRNIGLDDDKNGVSADGRNMCGAVEQKDTSTGRTNNEKPDVNNGEKDAEEERTKKRKSGHGLVRLLPDVTQHGG